MAGNPACWWSWVSVSEASAFYFATTSKILVARLAAIFPPTRSRVLGNTYSIACAFGLPWRKTISPIIANRFHQRLQKIFEKVFLQKIF
jgi:hypothetical protein